MIVNDPYFGDNASTGVPMLMNGPNRCGSELAVAGSCPMGLNAIPQGLRSIRIKSVDRELMLDAEDDNILPGWDAKNKSWAQDAPCHGVHVAQEKGPCESNNASSVDMFDLSTIDFCTITDRPNS
jgi:hypothetical protein